MIDWLQLDVIALLNVIMIDVVLAGDNAIVVGLAASRVAPEIRAKVIFWGIAGAVLLRIVFAALASQLLAITGLTLAGGILLLWVSWKMYSQMQGGDHAGSPQNATAAGSGAGSGADSELAQIGLRGALWQIIVADLSMSLDNVLAVAGAAKGSSIVLIIGLAVAVVLMAIASHYIARLLVTYPWITWIGLLIILYVALEMIWSGWHQVERAYPVLWSGKEVWRAITVGR